MTMFIERTDSDTDIKVVSAFGPTLYVTTEHYQHMRLFWGQLGRALNEIEKQERRKRDARERARQRDEHAADLTDQERERAEIRARSL
jgi:hypothetical protein